MVFPWRNENGFKASKNFFLVDFAFFNKLLDWEWFLDAKILLRLIHLVILGNISGISTRYPISLKIYRIINDVTFFDSIFPK